MINSHFATIFLTLFNNYTSISRTFPYFCQDDIKVICLRYGVCGKGLLVVLNIIVISTFSIKEVGLETPKHWTVMREGQQVLTVSLKPTDKEYKDVEQHFLKSLGRVPKISKVIKKILIYIYSLKA